MTKKLSEIHARLGLSDVAAEDDEILTGTLVAVSACIKYTDKAGNVHLVQTGLDQGQIDAMKTGVKPGSIAELEAQI